MESNWSPLLLNWIAFIDYRFVVDTTIMIEKYTTNLIHCGQLFHITINVLLLSFSLAKGGLNMYIKALLMLRMVVRRSYGSVYLWSAQDYGLWFASRNRLILMNYFNLLLWTLKDRLIMFMFLIYWNKCVW